MVEQALPAQGAVPVFYRCEPADVGTRIFWISDSVVQFGYTAEEMMASPLGFQPLIADADADEWAVYLDIMVNLRARRAGRDWFTNVFRVRCADGSLVTVRDQMCCVWRDGEIVEIAGMFVRIDEFPTHVPVDARRSLDVTGEYDAEVLGMAVHDLRGPLARIVNFAALMREGRAAGSEVRSDWLARIEDAAQEMDEVVRQSLEWAQTAVHELHRQWVGIPELIREAASRLTGGDADWIAVEVRGGEPKPAHVDAGLLRRAFANVLGNLRQHGAGPFEAVFQHDARALRIVLSDRGPGLPAKVLAQFGQPFVSGAKGTGLGLAIARQAVERHGGVFAARNREGGGAEFHIALPLEAVRT